ncbi:MAG TPA: bifunctional phosphopantothenoylcysteine decarboxylase/phosphopantothenate--cysteine ligase CoaBC, partial [Candidatus Cloacimonadota bacterium]|nr:bifunctional phosphopantothenoylcysteine decarboxylase/phosphopantothenate--cysteine ligase CoaBC [Candidatus Cloacimonadota bacterium]
THGTVHTELFGDNDPIPHINLADWADIIVVAPATANTIAKASYGLADDLLSSCLLAATAPILWIPAMNVHMYENPATQENIERLRQRGHLFLEPESGLLACGYEGKGKYPPNEEIVFAIETYLNLKPDLYGKKVLISAGSCREMIDPMRCITNLSSGKMGVALARAAALRGASVTLVYGGISVAIPHYLSKAIHTADSESMSASVLREAQDKDWIIMAAAVSDYKPVKTSLSKLKKQDTLSFELHKTLDILTQLGKDKKPGQILVGFAAETDELITNAKKKLKAKNLDLIIANHLSVVEQDCTTATAIDRHQTHELAGTKFDVAHRILDLMKQL